MHEVHHVGEAHIVSSEGAVHVVHQPYLVHEVRLAHTVCLVGGGSRGFRGGRCVFLTPSHNAHIFENSISVNQLNIKNRLAYLKQSL